MYSIGIDIGTENSAAAITTIINGSMKSVIIPSGEGTPDGKTTPSYITFAGKNIYTGMPAKKMEKIYPDGTIKNFKRKIGTDYLFKTGNEFHTPQELTAILLTKIKMDAEIYLKDKIRDAVITVPAYFNDNQRNATKVAADLAGIKVKRLINEPTAAAIAYGFNQFLDERELNENVIVYDMGAGTLDVTILNIRKRTFSVLSTSGDTMLGGIEMTNALYNHLRSVFIKNNINIDSSEKIFYLKEFAEYAKIWLTYNYTISFSPSSVLSGDFTGRGNINIEITRDEFNSIIEPIIERSFRAIDEAFYKSGITKNNVNHLIFIGGPTKIPFLQNTVEKYLGIKALSGIDPMYTVAIGASIIAASKAEIREAIKTGIIFKDVTPLTLGNVIINDIVVPMIPANTRIPCSVTKPFTTVRDYQKEIVIKIVQGERPIGSYNELIGELRLTDLKPAPRGEVTIDVTYVIDRNGILRVSARDSSTGSENHIIIKKPINMDPEKIERIKREVKKYYDSDMQIKNIAELMNNANEMLYRLKKIANFQSASGKISYYNISQDIIKLTDLIKNKDIKNLKTLIEKLKNDYNINY
ncbi:Hsp70 family protein [Acidiplasma sp.]|uniref:Hsp70 family protein n=1 Tax=Acidiplasma sp. TaxID=1872114 RepID=UPI0025909D22|nr:Hsp70 family protein [Acidiplasma sp.]